MVGDVGGEERNGAIGVDIGDVCSRRGLGGLHVVFGGEGAEGGSDEYGGDGKAYASLLVTMRLLETVCFCVVIYLRRIVPRRAVDD